VLRKPVILLTAGEDGELRLPEDCMSELGTKSGTRGMVQVSRQRLFLVPIPDVVELRAEIRAFAEELESGSATLQQILTSLPSGPDPLTGITRDEDVDLRTELECILHDQLRPAIQKLRRTAELTREH
jgi:hypothetical protein